MRSMRRSCSSRQRSESWSMSCTYQCDGHAHHGSGRSRGQCHVRINATVMLITAAVGVLVNAMYVSMRRSCSSRQRLESWSMPCTYQCDGHAHHGSGWSRGQCHVRINATVMLITAAVGVVVNAMYVSMDWSANLDLSVCSVD